MSSKLLAHRPALCNIVSRIAQEAGELILAYYDGEKDMGASISKADGSPVTIADQEAERLITQRLKERLPDITVVGEEAFSQGHCSSEAAKEDYFWLVDPLDGTGSFIRGNGCFTVNIALIHKGNPVLGAIYEPNKGELYAGYVGDDGQGRAYRHFEETDKEKDMRTRAMPKNGLTVYTGVSAGLSGDADHKVVQDFKVRKVERVSSSYKLCVIANGKADMYPRLGDTCWWDIAAGHAILRAAGGDVRDLNGHSLRYADETNTALLNPSFIAASGDVLDHAAF